MKYLLFLAGILPIFLNTGCRKSTIAAGVPKCVKTNIEANKVDADWYVGKVEEYRFQENLVYAFIPDNAIIADAPSYVMTSTCDSLCSVGGFGGAAVNLCNGGNFQDAVFVRVVWDKYK